MLHTQLWIGKKEKLKKANEGRKTSYLSFMDLQPAYDRIDRVVLWHEVILISREEVKGRMK